MEEISWDIQRAESLSSQPAQWDEFIASQGYPAFMRSDFLLPALDILSNEGVRLAIGRRGGSVVVTALLQQIGIGQWCTFQPSQLPLGAWVMAPELQWRDVMTSLLRALPNMAVSLSVTQQDPRFVARPEDCALIETLDYVPTAWVDLDGSFDAFWEARGKNLRQNLKKARRKLEEQVGPLRCEFAYAADGVDAAFVQFAALESVGWKAEAGSAIAVDNTQGRFYRSMLKRYAERGTGFAIVLSAGERVVAVDFGVADDHSLVLLKTTYDESLKTFSPGQLLHESAFERLFNERKQRRVEFYGRMMDWHSRWTERSCMLFHLNCYRSPLVRQLKNVASRLRKTEETAAS